MCRDEVEKLTVSHSGMFDAAKLRGWVLSGEERNLADDEKERMEGVFKHSQVLTTVLTMRRDLAALWERSSSSREQLLSQLHDWTARAEQSGIEQLREFSMRLKRYAV
jgi:stearoyl-CoA desaturase (delta-9 desaturase)